MMNQTLSKPETVEQLDAKAGCPALPGSALPDPWEDGKNSVEHLTDCEVDFCERCEHLIDGFYMSCDHCGHWGHQDSDAWVLCHGMPFCNEQCRDAYFGCDASEFSETEPLHLSQNTTTMAGDEIALPSVDGSAPRISD